MKNPANQPHGDNNLTKDQLAEEGIEVDYSSPSAIRQAEKYRNDLAEEDGQKDASWKSSPAPESETQGANQGYYNGMSQ